MRKCTLFTPHGFIDLQTYVKDFGIEDNSLQRIYAILFGERISKSQRLTNWEAESLTEKQQLYAALDAWACLKIYNELEKICNSERL
jgi:ribonuclease D